MLTSEKKTVPGTVFASFARGRYLYRGIRKMVGSLC